MYRDFGYDDDTVITTLEKNMEELKKGKLDYPGPPTSEELPRREFGVFIEPTFEKKIGRRAEEFSDVEKATKENVTLVREKSAREVAEYQETHISIGDGVELAGTETNSEISSVISNESSSDESNYNEENECTRL